MQKAFVKKNPPWVNYPDISTPIIAEELNRVETGIDTIDNRVVAFDTSKANTNDVAPCLSNLQFDSTTGTFTVTRLNGVTYPIDTDIEKIAINFDYDDDPTSAHYQQLVIELDDGTYKYIDLSALITQYEFEDTATIHFAVGNDGEITASVINGSITADKLQPNYLADITTQANNASASATSAGNSKLDAEAWANGTRNGSDVPSTDPAYHNNSKYWKDQAQAIADGSIGGLSDVDIDTPTLANGQSLIYNSSTQMWENKNLIRPHLIILSETGSVVTATKGTTVITATETSTGHFECDVTEFGTWVIDAVLSGDDAQVSLVVDTVKVYTVDDSHLHADITVTFPSGGTCSCSKSGETTLYANTNPYTFTVHTSGTWTITVTANGETYTESVNITTSGQTTSLTMPVGSTVTPTDSVATLLSCALINDTSITSISDLLADSTTLLAVISSNNAIDYLVRSTTFASDVTADSTAMSYIGLNNYASNTLLADSTWKTAICNSTYFESVLNAKAPVMTSNNTPSGECFGSTASDSGYTFYRAFDNNSSTSYRSNATTSGTYVGYTFTSAKKIVFAKLSCTNLGSSSAQKTLSIDGSNDSANWNSLGSVELTIPATTTTNSNVVLNNNTNYVSYRLYATSSIGRLVIPELNFYGRVDV